VAAGAYDDLKSNIHCEHADDLHVVEPFEVPAHWARLKKEFS
jgi:hypothetical protein